MTDSANDGVEYVVEGLRRMEGREKANPRTSAYLYTRQSPLLSALPLSSLSPSTRLRHAWMQRTPINSSPNLLRFFRPAVPVSRSRSPRQCLGRNIIMRMIPRRGTTIPSRGSGQRRPLYQLQYCFINSPLVHFSDDCFIRHS